MSVSGWLTFMVGYLVALYLCSSLRFSALHKLNQGLRDGAKQASQTAPSSSTQDGHEGTAPVDCRPDWERAPEAAARDVDRGQEAAMTVPVGSLAKPYASPPAVEQSGAGAVCLDCGLRYDEFPLDLLLPRSQWLEIHPTSDDGGGLLCAACMVRRASNIPGATAVHAVIEISPCRSA